MADRQTVIKGLECCASMNGNACRECPYSSDCIDYEGVDYEKLYQAGTARLAADALALLKEQEEPKQIVRKQCKKEYEDGAIDYFAEWYCPHCKSLIVRGFDNPSIKFCYKCGNPIDWSK